MINKWNASLSWFLRFWPTNMSFFTNSQKFEIFHFVSLLLKYIRYQDLHYLIIKLLTRNFGFSRYNMAIGVRALGLEDKVSMQSFLLRIYVFTLYQPSEGQRKVPFVCLFWFFCQKRAEKLKKTGLLNKVITGGPLFSSHPVVGPITSERCTTTTWCNGSNY